MKRLPALFLFFLFFFLLSSFGTTKAFPACSLKAEPSETNPDKGVEITIKSDTSDCFLQADLSRYFILARPESKKIEDVYNSNSIGPEIIQKSVNKDQIKLTFDFKTEYITIPGGSPLFVVSGRKNPGSWKIIVCGKPETINAQAYKDCENSSVGIASLKINDVSSLPIPESPPPTDLPIINKETQYNCGFRETENIVIEGIEKIEPDATYGWWWKEDKIGSGWFFTDNFNGKRIIDAGNKLVITPDKIGGRTGEQTICLAKRTTDGCHSQNSIKIKIFFGPINEDTRCFKLNGLKAPDPCQASHEYIDADIGEKSEPTTKTKLKVTIKNVKAGNTYKVEIHPVYKGNTIDPAILYEKTLPAESNNDILYFEIPETGNLFSIGARYGMKYAILAKNVKYDDDACWEGRLHEIITLGEVIQSQENCPIFYQKTGVKPRNPAMVNENVTLEFTRTDEGKFTYGIIIDGAINYIARLMPKRSSVNLGPYEKEGDHKFIVKAYSPGKEETEERPQGMDCPQSGGSFSIGSPPNPFPCAEWIDLSTNNTLDKSKPDDLKKINDREHLKKCVKVNTAIGDIAIGDPRDFIKQIFALILSLSGGIALLLIIKSGYEFMTSQENPEKIQGARETITSAIIGLLFIILSMLILQVIGVDILRIPGFG